MQKANNRKLNFLKCSYLTSTKIAFYNALVPLNLDFARLLINIISQSNKKQTRLNPIPHNVNSKNCKHGASSIDMIKILGISSVIKVN